MELSKKAKIALVLGIVFVVAVIIIIIIATQKSPSATEPTATPESGDIYVPGTTKYPENIDEILNGQTSPPASGSPAFSASTSPSDGSATARTPVSTVDENGIRTYTIDVTPAPNAGPYDWTRTVSKLNVYDISNSPIAKKSACEILGFESSWSNIIGKISCDTINFLDEKVTIPLMEMSCALTAQNIEYDTGRPITYRFEGGACLIIDRE